MCCVGKGENIWDRFSHAGGRVHNNDTGDIACDSYNKYQEDVRLLKSLGVQLYIITINVFNYLSFDNNMLKLRCKNSTCSILK